MSMEVELDTWEAAGGIGNPCTVVRSRAADPQQHHLLHYVSSARVVSLYPDLPVWAQASLAYKVPCTCAHFTQGTMYVCVLHTRYHVRVRSIQRFVLRLMR